MDLYSIILIPFLFGLIGFVEPCSLGINMIFLNHIKKLSKAKRVLESLIFMLIRGVILALVGLGAAYIGQSFIQFQGSLFAILGAVYFLLGLYLVLKHYIALPAMRIDLSQFILFFTKGKKTASLGVVFGLVIPACAIPFIIALIGQAAFTQSLSAGFITLLVFGITLSLPLLLLSVSEKATTIIQKIAKKMTTIPWLSGTILMIFGILTILSRSWWLGAA